MVHVLVLFDHVYWFFKLELKRINVMKDQELQGLSEEMADSSSEAMAETFDTLIAKVQNCLATSSEQTEERMLLITSTLFPNCKNMSLNTLFSENVELSIPAEEVDARELFSFLASYRDALNLRQLLFFTEVLQITFHQLAVDTYRRRQSARGTSEILRVWCQDLVQLSQSFLFPTCYACIRDSTDNFTPCHLIEKISLLMNDIFICRCADTAGLLIPFACCTSGKEEFSCTWMNSIEQCLRNCYTLEDISSILFWKFTLVEMGRYYTAGALGKQRTLDSDDSSVGLEDNSDEQCSGAWLPYGCLRLLQFLLIDDRISFSGSWESLFFLLCPAFTTCFKFDAAIFIQLQEFLHFLVHLIPIGHITFDHQDDLTNNDSPDTSLNDVFRSMSFKQQTFIDLISTLIEIGTRDNCSAQEISRNLIDDLVLRCHRLERMQLQLLLIPMSPHASVAQHFLRGLWNEWKMYCNTPANMEFERHLSSLLLSCATYVLKEIHTGRFDSIDTLIRILNFFAAFFGSDVACDNSRCVYISRCLDTSASPASHPWHKSVLRLAKVLSCCGEILDSLTSHEYPGSTLDHFSLSLSVEHVKMFYSPTH